MTRRGEWIAVGSILAAMAGLLALFAAASDTKLVGPGTEAPDFRAVNLSTGEDATLADYAGEVVMLNIWATWCKPCEEEMPSMQRLYEELGPQGLKVVAVSIDTDSPEKVRAWAEERGLTFDILQDRSGRIQLIYQTTGVPESFAIDYRGLIVKKQIGAWEWDQPASLALFRRLLAQDADTAAPRD
jgi:peroxiredoxin